MVIIFTEPLAADVDRTTRLMIMVGVITLLVSAAVSWVVAGQLLRPIRVVQRTAAEITERDLTRRIPVRGSDDVAELAATFNAMLDRLETAFATEQRFVDDAGHELRTPITIIRGHLELMGDDPQERQSTIALVTQELDRMGRIVSDLLLLAKSERPDFVQAHDSVDVAEVTVELDALVEPLGERRWRLTDVAEGHYRMDRQRIVQAVLQLAQNAVQHTRPGDRIDLGSAVAGTPQDPVLEFTVIDDGPGVGEQDRALIFDRFTHGRTRTVGQAEDRAGAGLGLSIVKAIADGHHGGVEVTDEPGRGARFRLWLPALGVGVRQPVDDPDSTATMIIKPRPDGDLAPAKGEDT